VKVSTHLLILIDMLIDGLMADLPDTLAGEGFADLLGTPLLIAQLGFHQFPKFRCDPQTFPLKGFSMTLGSDVTVVFPRHTTAPQLPGDRRGEKPDSACDLFLRRSVAVHGFDGVALLAGQAGVGWHLVRLGRLTRSFLQPLAR
jgi:hypothetical protein